MAARNYRDLVVWQKSMELCQGVYELNRQFPREETYGLSQQMRRAAVSIPSNIAEGQGRGGDTEFDRFLIIAYGSLREVETQILLAVRLRFVTSDDAEPVLNLAAEVGRLINGLRRRFRSE